MPICLSYHQVIFFALLSAPPAVNTTTQAFAPRSKFELRTAIDACVRLIHPDKLDCVNEMDGIIENPDAAGTFCGVFDTWLQKSFSVNMQQRANYRKELRSAAQTIVKLRGPTLLEFKRGIDLLGLVLVILKNKFALSSMNGSLVSVKNAFDSALTLWLSLH